MDAAQPHALPVCAACGHARLASETAPAWQCPACGRAYAKTGALPDPRPQAPRRGYPAGGAYAAAQHLLTILLLAGIALAIAAYLHKGRLPDPAALDPLLREPPRQVSAPGERFEFGHRGRTYTVEPVAEYELQGLVVTHNDISSIFDAYHDSDSVDSKDLCVVWGRNLDSADYQAVEYWSTSWTCNARWREGVTFHVNELSNNHLITADAAMRARINSVRVGDQVRLRGRLVNYRADDNPENWRRSSTTRDDSGNGACEVIYVEDFSVLRRGNPGWYFAYSAALWVIGAALVAKLALALGVGEGRRPGKNSMG